MSTAKLTVESFLNLVKHSGLLDQEQVKKAWKGFKDAGVPVDDAKEVADQMVTRNLLTRWQAEKLLQGKHKGFFLGKYRLLRLLGSGGMASVYLAEHVLMRRRVAIKVLPKQRIEDSSYLERFHREAQAVAALDHRNIVRAYDVDVSEQNHFLVMEYVSGSNLQDLVVQGGVLSPVKAAEYTRQAAEGLAHAHKAGLVHRDIKPGNVLLDERGTIKLLDLGLARFFDEGEEASLTLKHDEKVLGTADYLSPEQARDSHRVDIRSDIYSLGCTMYFSLTGHPPFPEGTMAMRLLAHQQREPTNIQTIRPDMPESLSAILAKMMAKVVDDRFQTGREVAETLQQWLSANGGDEWAAMQPMLGVSSGQSANLDSLANIARPPGSGDLKPSDSGKTLAPMPAAPEPPSTALPMFAAPPKSGVPQKPASSKVSRRSPGPSVEADDPNLANFFSQLSGIGKAEPKPAAPAPKTPPPKPAPPVAQAVSKPVAKPVTPPPVANATGSAAAETMAFPMPSADSAGTDDDQLTNFFASMGGGGPVSKSPPPTAAPVAPPAPAAAPKPEPAADPEEETFLAAEPLSLPEPAAERDMDFSFLEPTVDEPVAPKAAPIALPVPAAPAAIPVAAPVKPVAAPVAVAPPVARAVPVGAPVAAPVAAQVVAPAAPAAPKIAPSARTSKTKPKQPAWLIYGGAGLAAVLVLGLGWKMFSGSAAPTESEEQQASKPKKKKRAGRPEAARKEVPLRRELHVGSGREYSSIAAAMAEAKQNFNPGRGAVQILRLAPGDYPERIAIDKSYPPGLQFIAEPGGEVTLSGSGGGAVVEIDMHDSIDGYTGFRLEGVRINATAKAVAVKLTGASKDSVFKNVEVSGFTTSGFELRGAYAFSTERNVLTGVVLKPGTPQAVGIRLGNQGDLQTNHLMVHNCRFVGPMEAGVVCESGAMFIDFLGNIFSETQTGIRLEKEGQVWRAIVFGNNTFYKAPRGIVFTNMPAAGSDELGIYNNLFLQPGGWPVVVEKGYNEREFSGYFAKTTTGVANNWTDATLPAPAPPEAIKIFEPGNGLTDVKDLAFLSTDPASADFMRPSPGSPLIEGGRTSARHYGGSNNQLQEIFKWIGAVGH